MEWLGRPVCSEHRYESSRRQMQELVRMLCVCLRKPSVCHRKVHRRAAVRNHWLRLGFIKGCSPCARWVRGGRKDEASPSLLRALPSRGALAVCGRHPEVPPTHAWCAWPRARRDLGPGPIRPGGMRVAPRRNGLLGLSLRGLPGRPGRGFGPTLLPALPA